MNKLLREHAAWRVYQDALAPDPVWRGVESMPGLFGKPKGPKRALNQRVRPFRRRELPRHIPLGATLLRRLRDREGQPVAKTDAAQAALRALGDSQ